MYESTISINENKCSPVRSLLDYMSYKCDGALDKARGIDYAGFRRAVELGKKNGLISEQPKRIRKPRKHKYANGKSDELALKITAIRKQHNIGIPTLSTILGIHHCIIYNCESNKADLKNQQMVYDKLINIDLKNEIAMHYAKRQRHLKKKQYATGY